MSSYLGRHAELYDVFYADKPYASEADAVHRWLQQFAPGAHRLLELACGTGAHALELSKRGYEILATDYSNDMLAVAQRKARAASSNVAFQWQDMRALDLPGQSFDAVICLFDAIGYVATNDALIQVLRGVHRHLQPNGIFIFEFWHAAAMLRHYTPVRVRRWQTPGGEVQRISETTLDYAQQTAHVKYTVHEFLPDGHASNFTETQTNRYFLLQEMALLLTTNNFTPLKWFAGFVDDETITDETWHIVAIARRASPDQ